ncbi:hypothetical protein [Paracoccus homiensis]|uniref:Uncharacterized protein n=1 Tax=Paracoccus homiensis TaxID=364199 RepID=A0A1I0JJF5_9RHOB|nr:hypothetical protein [Paracoccus homiensis]SEU09698.1 hypothetical protein SAMN04489858_1283 [Paracoccus homiensis]
MSGSSLITYGLSSLLFGSFTVNLLLGKSGGAIIGNLAEMLLLAGSVAMFGIGTLISEARGKSRD